MRLACAHAKREPEDGQQEAFHGFPFSPCSTAFPCLQPSRPGRGSAAPTLQEILQHFLPPRTCDLFDLLSNALGAGLAVLAWCLPRIGTARIPLS
jgi:hypothetical protein